MPVGGFGEMIKAREGVVGRLWLECVADADCRAEAGARRIQLQVRVFSPSSVHYLACWTESGIRSVVLGI
jgi:hypothetical protein